MRVAIIGIKGIGMAHAIACELLNYDVVAVLDNDPNAEARLVGPWVNKWGPYEESIENPLSQPMFTTDIKEFGLIPADLLIIASPTRTHIPYLLHFGNDFRKILVEKPLAYTKAEMDAVPQHIRDKTFVGHEYLLHPFLNDYVVSRPLWLSHSHSYVPTEEHKKECGVVWDLGTHALAHLLSAVPAAGRVRYEVTWSNIKPTVATFGLEVDMCIPAVVQVAYPTYINDGLTGLFINENQLSYDKTLFTKQLLAVVAGTHPATFALGAKVCEIIESISPMDQESK